MEGEEERVKEGANKRRLRSPSLISNRNRQARKPSVHHSKAEPGKPTAPTVSPEALRDTLPAYEAAAQLCHSRRGTCCVRPGRDSRVRNFTGSEGLLELSRGQLRGK